MLIGNASVQKELKLDDEQIEKAKEVAEKITARSERKCRAFRTSSPEERRDQDAGHRQGDQRDDHEGVGEFLKPEQITRLKQISYQRAVRRLSVTPRSPRS